MSASTSSSLRGVFFLKGARVDLGIHKPPRVAPRRLRYTDQRFEPGPVLALLEPDQGLAEDAAHPFAELVVGELERLPCPEDPGCDERQRRVAEELLERFVGRRAHVAVFYYVAGYVSRVCD